MVHRKSRRSIRKSRRRSHPKRRSYPPRQALHTRYSPKMEISSSDMLMLSSPTQGIGSFLNKAKTSASKAAAKVSEVKAKAEVAAKKAVEKGKELHAKATELADKAVKATEDLQKKAEQIQQQALEVRKQYDQAKEQVSSVGASLKTPSPTTAPETIASDVKATTSPAQYLRKHSRRRY